MIDRRSFIGSLAALSLPGISVAEELVVTPNTELVGRSDMYAKLARNGPYQEAVKAVRVNLDGGSVPVSIYISEGAQKAKLVVFSHGAYADPQVYSPLLRFLTTHGYCVIAPIHESADAIASLDGSLDLTSEGNLLKQVSFWERRAYECRYARDSYSVIANTLGITIDATFPIFIGHSFGGLTGHLLAGAALETESGALRLQQDGWAGFFLISPPGVGSFGLSEGSWSEVSSPLMVMTADGDQDLVGQSSERYIDAYSLSVPPYKHLAYLSMGSASVYSGQRARAGTKEYYLFFDIRAALNAFVASYGSRNEQALVSLYDGSLQEFSYQFMSIASR